MALDNSKFAKNARIANFFWMGELTNYELANVSSFVKNGFEVKVWTYDSNIGSLIVENDISDGDASVYIKVDEVEYDKNVADIELSKLLNYCEINNINPKFAIIEIGDRNSAIKFAVSKLQDNDLLLIAGKGHESTQTIGMESLPFDDFTVSKEAIKNIKKNGIIS